MQATYDAWVSTCPSTPVDTPSSYHTGATYEAVVQACTESLANLEFLVQRMEADPEFNRFCLAVYDVVALPMGLVEQPTDNLNMTRAVDCVKRYRAVHPYVLTTRIAPCCPGVKTIIAFCGPMYSGKTTAAKAIGNALFTTRMYNVYQWSFATSLKNFCIKYFDHQMNPMSRVMNAYYHDKFAIPPSAAAWAAAGSVNLRPASEIMALLSMPSADAATKVRDRLLHNFSLDLASDPSKLNGRRILQVTGSVFRDICGMDFWIEQLSSLLSAKTKAENAVHIIDDVRFPNEAAWLRSIGASIVRIHTPSSLCEPPKHISEMCVGGIHADFAYENDLVSVSSMIEGLLPFVISVIRSNKIRC